MRPRCVYTDLDGTLLGKGASLFHDGEGRFSLLPARALEACDRAGVEVVIKSGRRKAQVMEDARIIGLLQSDARISNRELARRLGIAPSTSLERVRALTRQGVIRGYHADIDPAALNRGVQAMVSVQVRPLSRAVIDTFKASASKMPEVLHVFVLAGGDDFLLHVGVPDLDALHAFLLTARDYYRSRLATA